MTTRTLTAVTRAAARRKQAQETYRRAVADARADGHTLAAIGEAAGIKRQNVHKLLRRTPKEGTS